MPGRWKHWLAMGLDRLDYGAIIAPVSRKRSDQKILCLDRSWTNEEGIAAITSLPLEYSNDVGATIHEQITVPPEWDDIPRAGIRFTVPAQFEQLSWYGLGPDESYSDRYKSQLLGRWNSTVDEQYHPYCYPQEHGNHHGTRSFSLTDQ